MTDTPTIDPGRTGEPLTDLDVLQTIWGPDAVTDTALAIPDSLTFEEWRKLGDDVLRSREASDWWVGDWLEFGWAHYATGPDGQEISAEAARLRSVVAAMTTLDLDVLRTARDTARRTPAARRRRTLSFAHHQQVLELDDQRADALLDQAEAEGLESADLKAAVRKANAVEGGEAPEPVLKPAKARVTITAGVGERDQAVVTAAAAAAEAAALEVLAGARLTGQVAVS